ncbi:hypothetical protein [Nonomuraea sp. NPDC003754]
MSGVLPRYYRPERAVAADESVSWVMVDEDLDLHVEVCAYLAGLRATGRAFNTGRPRRAGARKKTSTGCPRQR